MTLFIDENLAQADDGEGVVTCRHCDTPVGVAADPLRDARVRETAPRTAGPSVRADASNFADREIVFRRTFCPKCLTLLQSEVVPADEPSSRTRSLKVVVA
jgi:RNase P subunit RPR2